VTGADLEFVCALVRARSGLVIGGERRFFVETRLAPLARRERLGSVGELLAKVRDQPNDGLARAAIEAMTLQETSFFRDRSAFAALATRVLPQLAAGKSGLRLWSAGCGKGQEAYSLAMLTAEGEHQLPPTEILATDLNASALEKAQAGIYTHFEVQRGLPIRRLLTHFEGMEDAWRVAPSIRQRVRWLRLNLVDPFTTPKPYDLILCRYVVSDFAPDARSAVLSRLEAALAPGGRLMLGVQEPAPPGFVPVAGAAGLFARQGEEDVHSAAA
jgi:chemotaxis protein methyltransferase CheR